jgi:hypothetical protein
MAVEIKTKAGPGGRHYIHPVTGETVPSVTTILGVMDKPALVGWAAKSVAEYAADNVEAVSLLGRDERVALLKGVPFRNRDKAADRGTEAHTYAERRLTFGIAPSPSNRSAELVDEVLAALDPTPLVSEGTVFNSTVGYAGTFDGVWRVDGRIVMVDWKSGKGVYSESGLQLNAYARGEEVITPSEVFSMPRVDEAWIIHVPNEGGWKVHPVALGNEEWLAFQAARMVWRWKHHRADFTMGQPVQGIPNRERAVRA